MMWINRALESIDLSTAFGVLAMTGAILSVLVMQADQHDAESRRDPPILRFTHRMALWGLSLSLLWSLSYLLQKDWQPWPPFLGILLALDTMLAIRVTVLNWRDITALFHVSGRHVHPPYRR